MIKNETTGVSAVFKPQTEKRKYERPQLEQRGQWSFATGGTAPSGLDSLRPPSF